MADFAYPVFFTLPGLRLPYSVLTGKVYIPYLIVKRKYNGILAGACRQAGILLYSRAHMPDRLS